MIMSLKTGVNERGELLARQIEILTDTGAYNDQGLYVTSAAGSKITGLYRVPNIKFDGKVVFTNKVWGGAFRGYGNPQVTFAIESQMEEIAEKLGIDPLELRLLNANKQGEVTVAGSKLVSCGFTECLEKSAAAAGWKEKRKNKKNSNGSKARGIGMASLFHTGGGSIGAHGSSLSGAFIKVEADGSLDLLTGVPDVGQGSDTVLAMIAAEELGIKVQDVRVHAGDTDITPYTLGVRGSRETFIAGNAVKLAAQKAKEELLVRATSFLDVEKEQLGVAEGKIYVRSNPDRFVTVAEVVAKPMYDRYAAFPVGVPIVASACYKDHVSEFSDDESGYGNYCPCWVYGTQVVEIEVDKETGQVSVLRVVAAHDVGKPINPMAIEGQFEGAIIQGIGFALTEQVIWDRGKVLSQEFADYKLPTMMDTPKIETILVETDDPFGPFGAKGVGEAGLVPTAAAIANAVYDAVGVWIRELPMTQEKLLAALKKKESNP
jgi:xanthine dehydrogenase molybdenum-binding subunit